MHSENLILYFEFNQSNSVLTFNGSLNILDEFYDWDCQVFYEGHSHEVTEGLKPTAVFNILKMVFFPMWVKDSTDKLPSMVTFALAALHDAICRANWISKYVID